MNHNLISGYYYLLNHLENMHYRYPEYFKSHLHFASSGSRFHYYYLFLLRSILATIKSFAYLMQERFYKVPSFLLR